MSRGQRDTCPEDGPTPPRAQEADIVHGRPHCHLHCVQAVQGTCGSLGAGVLNYPLLPRASRRQQFMSPFELAFLLHSHFAAGAVGAGVEISVASGQWEGQWRCAAQSSSLHSLQVSPEPSLAAIFGVAFGARLEAELHCRRIAFRPNKALAVADVSCEGRVGGACGAAKLYQHAGVRLALRLNAQVL